jgi:hypothetical protein
MKPIILILILVWLLALASHGQVERVLHNETGREWAARGNLAADNHAYEVSLDEVLLTDKPYQIPAKNNPRYNDAFEALLNAYDASYDNYVTVRAYKQGIFIGYAILQVVPVPADKMQKL